MTLKNEENFFELTDQNDRASALEAKFNENALKVARKKNIAETAPEFDGVHCLECSQEIPTARLILEKIRCIECQIVIEKKIDFMLNF